MPGWYIGALINVGGNICANLGTNIMKLGHNRRAALDMPEEDKPPIFKSRFWQCGVGIFLTGNILTFASFAFAAQSLLAALGSIQLVSNVFFASFILKETVTWFIVASVGCIVVGTVVLVIFGNHSTTTYTVDDLVALYKHTPYIVYLVALVFLVFAMFILYHHGRRLIKNNKASDGWMQALPAAYAVYCALIGTQSVVFSKSLSVMLRGWLDGNNPWVDWYAYVVIICFLTTAIFWGAHLHKGIMMFPAMIIAPLMQIMWILFSIVSGLIYFQEYLTYDGLSYGMFFAGIVIMFIGVYMLTKAAGVKREGYDQMNDAASDADCQVLNGVFEPQAGDKGGGATGFCAEMNPSGGKHERSSVHTHTFNTTFRRTCNESMRSRAGGSELAASLRSNSDDGAPHDLGRPSLMDTLTRKMHAGRAAKSAGQAMLGLDMGMAAIAMFTNTMPADDLYSPRKQPLTRRGSLPMNGTANSLGGRNSTSGGGGGNGGGSLSGQLPMSTLLDALPQSRFPAAVNKHSHMAAIVEAENVLDENGERSAHGGVLVRSISRRGGPESGGESDTGSANGGRPGKGADQAPQGVRRSPPGLGPPVRSDSTRRAAALGAAAAAAAAAAAGGVEAAAGGGPVPLQRSGSGSGKYGGSGKHRNSGNGGSSKAGSGYDSSGGSGGGGVIRSNTGGGGGGKGEVAGRGWQSPIRPPQKAAASSAAAGGRVPAAAGGAYNGGGVPPAAHKPSHHRSASVDRADRSSNGASSRAYNNTPYASAATQQSFLQDQALQRQQAQVQQQAVALQAQALQQAQQAAALQHNAVLLHQQQQELLWSRQQQQAAAPNAAVASAAVRASYDLMMMRTQQQQQQHLLHQQRGVYNSGGGGGGGGSFGRPSMMMQNPQQQAVAAGSYLRPTTPPPGSSNGVYWGVSSEGLPRAMSRPNSAGLLDSQQEQRVRTLMGNSYASMLGGTAHLLSVSPPAGAGYNASYGGWGGAQQQQLERGRASLFPSPSEPMAGGQMLRSSGGSSPTGLRSGGPSGVFVMPPLAQPQPLRGGGSRLGFGGPSMWAAPGPWAES